MSFKTIICAVALVGSFSVSAFAFDLDCGTQKRIRTVYSGVVQNPDGRGLSECRDRAQAEMNEKIADFTNACADIGGTTTELSRSVHSYSNPFYDEVRVKVVAQVQCSCGDSSGAASR
jgi:hypothetical protein